jgi:phosphohistidine phosphatase SixA
MGIFMRARIFSTAFLALVMGAILMAPYVARADDSGAWQALRDGDAVLMMRHALAPGTGDPPDFRLDDCSTQRNLNETGREQARAWKPFLAEHGVTGARVFSSQWCRCLETAREMDMGAVTEWPSLNSFFGNRGNGPSQTRETIALVNGLEAGTPVILVSHQVNTTALTGVYPSSNEGVIIALPLSDDPRILARVSPGS